MGDEFENVNRYRDAECCENCVHYDPPSYSNDRLVSVQECVIQSVNFPPNTHAVCDKFESDN